MAIIDAIKKRRTYGATDNIVLEFWAGDHFMGDDFSAEEMPLIRVRVHGTNSLRHVEIIRNNRSVHRNGGGREEADITYRDSQPVPGTSFYYARVEQVDGMMAWSSPIWITLP